MKGPGELPMIGRPKPEDCSTGGAVDSVAQGLKGCNVLAHHGEKIPIHRLVRTGGDDDAGEARFLQYFNVPAERSALPDEKFGIRVFFPDAGQCSDVLRANFVPGFPE